MKELASKASDDGLAQEDKNAVADEWNQLIAELGEVGGMKFNGQALYGKAGGFTFQVGANTGDTLNISVAAVSNLIGTDVVNAGTGALEASGGGAAAGKLVANMTGASSASWRTMLDEVDNAIKTNSQQRSAIGASVNRLDYKITNLDTTVENVTSAEGLIRNVDEAKEQLNLAKYQVLAQTSLSGLAQAIQMPQMVLSLLQ